MIGRFVSQDGKVVSLIFSFRNLSEFTPAKAVQKTFLERVRDAVSRTQAQELNSLSFENAFQETKLNGAVIVDSVCSREKDFFFSAMRDPAKTRELLLFDAEFRDLYYTHRLLTS